MLGVFAASYAGMAAAPPAALPAFGAPVNARASLHDAAQESIGTFSASQLQALRTLLGIQAAALDELAAPARLGAAAATPSLAGNASSVWPVRCRVSCWPCRQGPARKSGFGAEVVSCWALMQAHASLAVVAAHALFCDPTPPVPPKPSRASHLRETVSADALYRRGLAARRTLARLVDGAREAEASWVRPAIVGLAALLPLVAHLAALLGALLAALLAALCGNFCSFASHLGASAQAAPRCLSRDPI